MICSDCKSYPARLCCVCHASADVTADPPGFEATCSVCGGVGLTHSPETAKTATCAHCHGYSLCGCSVCSRAGRDVHTAEVK